MKLSRTIPISLIATILVFGTTISMGMSTSFAQSYEDSYGKDKKTSNLNKQKVNCNNIIINGINSADQGTTGEDMINDITNDGEAGTGKWIENGNDKKESGSINENIINSCKNKHNKILVAPGTGTLSISKTITCTTTSGSFPEGATCNFLSHGGQGLEINPDDFIIEVTGNNPNPSSFSASSTPVEVTLGAGEYEISETPDELTIAQNIENIKQQPVIPDSLEIDGPIATFSGDCIQNGDFSAQGSIAEGESQTCNIDNDFVVTEDL